MCKFLGVVRNSVYYCETEKNYDSELDNLIIKILNESKKHYGTRKIKAELYKAGRKISGKLIGNIMKKIQFNFYLYNKRI